MLLRDILNHPVLVEAFSTIRDCARPRVPASVRGDEIPNSETVLTDIALRHAHRAGIFDAPRLLETLTEMTETPKEPFPQPWGALLSEEEIDAHLNPPLPEPPPPRRRRRRQNAVLPTT